MMKTTTTTAKSSILRAIIQTLFLYDLPIDQSSAVEVIVPNLDKLPFVGQDAFDDDLVENSECFFKAATLSYRNSKANYSPDSETYGPYIEKLLRRTLTLSSNALQMTKKKWRALRRRKSYIYSRPMASQENTTAAFL